MLSSIRESIDLRTRMHTDITESKVSRNTYRTIDSQVYPISLQRPSKGESRTRNPTYVSIFHKKKQKERGGESRNNGVESPLGEEGYKRGKDAGSLPYLRDKRYYNPIAEEEEDSEKRQLINLLGMHD